jgi:hypothetical protein
MILISCVASPAGSYMPGQLLEILNMSNQTLTSKEAEKKKFHDLINQPHRRINPCFMTGKGCVYTEQIDRDLNYRKRDECASGFSVLPFQPNTSVFYELCLKRFVHDSYSFDASPDASTGKVEIIKASSVRKTGYVICEKICKKIQESDFVIVDLSIANANVFYELGLAYGIGQKIIPIYHTGSKFGRAITDYLKCNSYVYKDLEPLEMEGFPLSSHCWKAEISSLIEPPSKTLLLNDIEIPGEDSVKNLDGKLSSNGTKPTDIHLSFATHVKAAIGVAVVNIMKEIELQKETRIPRDYLPKIEALKTADEVPGNASFKDILARVNQSFCAIIKTGGENCHPMMYFWLGYSHAQGRNVIPITEISENRGDIDDLAFDIRALWHMTFSKQAPEKLAEELQETLHQMITSDFSEWSRRRFWDALLEKRGIVSIFTGALHNKDFEREMIGDWDLRAASEMTSYFASHQYRATIESPVYAYEHLVTNGNVVKEQYIEALKSMLGGKNCVIVASPDVNPLTEIVLGKIYGINETHWFDETFDASKQPEAVVAFKTFKKKQANQVSPNRNPAVKRTFYREEEEENELIGPERGFKAPFLPNQKAAGVFISQTESAQKEFTVHAHLAIVPNPFPGLPGEDGKYIILINGVSGPATFALTHVLTGGVSKEFVSYPDEQGKTFDPDAESENILNQIIAEMMDNNGKASKGVQCIIEVKVGAAKAINDPRQATSRTIFDWRHILGWKLVEDRVSVVPPVKDSRRK